MRVRNAWSAGRAADVAELAQHGAAEFLAHGIGDQARRALHRLQSDIAGKAIGNHHIHFIRKNVVALDETHVVDIAGRQQIVRRLHDVVALDLLRADVEQAHTRLSCAPSRSAASTEPMTANWDNCPGVHEALAPKSSM